jgi:hypothetical protein
MQVSLNGQILFNQSHPVSCQEPEFTYLPHGEFENVFIIDTIPNNIDGFLVFGNGVLNHPDSVQNYTRAYAAKCDLSGELSWWKRFDEEGEDRISQWFNRANGNYGGMYMNHRGKIMSTFTTGLSTSLSDPNTKDYLLELDVLANVTSEILLDSTLDHYGFRGLIEDLSDSSYVLYGAYIDSLGVVNGNLPNAFLWKVDTLGNTVWLQSFGSTFLAMDVVKSIDGGYWVISYEDTGEECSDNFSINTDIHLIKTDEFGNEESRLIFGGNCADFTMKVVEYEMDKAVIAARLTNDDNEEQPFNGYFFTSTIEQLENNGMLVESSTRITYLNNEGPCELVDFYMEVDGSYLIVGNCWFADTLADIGALNKGFLLKLDENRDSLWLRSYRYYENEQLPPVSSYTKHEILETKKMEDGGYVCVGVIEQSISDPTPGLFTPWIFRVDSDGCLTEGCENVLIYEIQDLENSVLVYPNPCNNEFVIEVPFFTKDNSYNISLFDVNGRLVNKVENIPGYLTCTIDTSNLCEGVYQLILFDTMEKVRLVKKLIVAR